MIPAEYQPATREVRVSLRVVVDYDLVQSMAQGRGVSPETVLAEIAATVECRTHDAVRFLHAVRSVGVSITNPVRQQCG